MIPTTQSAVFASLSKSPPQVIDYPGATVLNTVSVTPPDGAVSVIIEAICPGEAGGDDGVTSTGGRGGGYSKRNAVSLSGVPTLHITNHPNDGGLNETTVRAVNGAGTVLCKAVIGSDNSASGVGDVKYNGGAGGSSTTHSAYGGGAGGPLGNGTDGGDQLSGVIGLGGGSPAGNSGAPYGGGGYGVPSSPANLGGIGLTRCTFLFE